MGIFPLKSIILTEGKRKQQVRKNKQQKTLSKQETDQVRKRRRLRDQALERTCEKRGMSRSQKIIRANKSEEELEESTSEECKQAEMQEEFSRRVRKQAGELEKELIK